MATIDYGFSDGGDAAEATFRVNINITLSKSKAMDKAEKDAAMADTPQRVRILVVQDDETWDEYVKGLKVLVNEVVTPKAFRPDAKGRFSVGYGVQKVDAAYEQY